MSHVSQGSCCIVLFNPFVRHLFRHLENSKLSKIADGVFSPLINLKSIHNLFSCSFLVEILITILKDNRIESMYLRSMTSLERMTHLSVHFHPLVHDNCSLFTIHLINNKMPMVIQNDLQKITLIKELYQDITPFLLICYRS